MKPALLISLVTLLAVAHAYVQPSLLSPDMGLNNAIVAAAAGAGGLICYFQVEFTTAGSSLVVTNQIQTAITNVVDQVVAGVDACAKPNRVSSHCFSIFKHGVLIQGCVANLGFAAQMNEQEVAACAAVDTGPLIGQTISTKYGNATITEASVCNATSIELEGSRPVSIDI
ncbi:unnamed protein product [Ostreobium quekettii]|uniref:Uncharacterized protein n=1 Tax=Ostreobium quekettii TaxID=121088 RepID=A0A8S1IKS9_9CHLO|nr:unnamed protein product [Ostreobium quekettii]